MIQRFLYDVLTSGMVTINEQPGILEDLFQENYSLSREEVDGIKEFFQTQTPNVIHGWARSDSTFPLYSIVLVREQEIEAVLADDAGQVEDETDSDYQSDCYTAIWEHTYDIMCFSENPDSVQYMYEVAKSLMFAAEAYFVQEGLFERHLSGSDVAPDARYVPEHLFLRRMTFSAQREFLRTDRNSKLYKAFQLRGLHVDSSGSSSDVGDVETNITPYGTT
jgi:hypothetical protein